MRPVEHNAAKTARATPTVKAVFYPLATIKCEGATDFRSQVARDVACLLDVDASVSFWRCRPVLPDAKSAVRAPDFLVTYQDGTQRLVDAPDREGGEGGPGRRSPIRYVKLTREDVYGGFRLENARDLLRYGNWRTSLGDRVRLLAALDEHGSLTFAECLGAMQETRPVAGLASLILSGFVEVDLDEAPLGPETAVRRIRR